MLRAHLRIIAMCTYFRTGTSAGVSCLRRQMRTGNPGGFEPRYNFNRIVASRRFTFVMPQSPYQQLELEFRRLFAFRGASSILHWDAAVMMSKGSADLRGDQLAALEI